MSENENQPQEFMEVKSSGKLNTNISENEFPSNEIPEKSREKGWSKVLSILFLVTSIVFIALYFNAKMNYNHQRQVSSSYKRQMEEAFSEADDYKLQSDEIQNELSKLTSEYPFIINNIEIGNCYKNGDMYDDYGSIIYSSNTMYLKPQISYTGFDSDSYLLKVKWYTPDGSVRLGSSSSNGFSQSDNYRIYKGVNTLTLSGWGNANKGHWKSGSYRIEIWYGESCLKAKSFYIY